MTDQNLSPLKNVSQTDAKLDRSIWQDVLVGAGTVALLASLFGCGTKNVDKTISPVDPEKNGIVATKTIENPAEDQVEGSQSIIVHAGAKKEDSNSNALQESPQTTPINGTALENNSTTTMGSRAEQIYQEILKDGGYIPDALKNNRVDRTEKISKIFADINVASDSPLVKKNGHTYLGVGNGAMLYIDYYPERIYRMDAWKGLTAGVLHFNITAMPAGAAVSSFRPLRNVPGTDSLMPNTLVDLRYVEDPTKNVVYNTTTFMEEVLTENDQVVAHVTQFADLNGDRRFDRVYEGYSLPMSPNEDTNDLLILASANGISHELYELYRNSDFDEVLKKAPDSFEAETVSGTYEYKLVTKTNAALEYRLTRESYERNRGESVSVEQMILDYGSIWIPYHFVITTDGTKCRATYSVGEDWGHEIMYGRTFSDGGDGLFRWANPNDPSFEWVDKIPGVIQNVEGPHKNFLVD